MIEFLAKASSEVLPDCPAKSFYLCAVDSLDFLPGATGPRLPENFGLFAITRVASQTNSFFGQLKNLSKWGLKRLSLFFVGCAYPSEEFADKCHWIVAFVGNSERSGVVRAEIKARGAG